MLREDIIEELHLSQRSKFQVMSLFFADAWRKLPCRCLALPFSRCLEWLGGGRLRSLENEYLQRQNTTEKIQTYSSSATRSGVSIRSVSIRVSPSRWFLALWPPGRLLYIHPM